MMAGRLAITTDCRLYSVYQNYHLVVDREFYFLNFSQFPRIQQSKSADIPSQLRILPPARTLPIKSVKLVAAPSDIKQEAIGAAHIDDFIGLVPRWAWSAGGPGNHLVTLRGVTSGGDQQNAAGGPHNGEGK